MLDYVAEALSLGTQESSCRLIGNNDQKIADIIDIDKSFMKQKYHASLQPCSRLPRLLNFGVFKLELQSLFALFTFDDIGDVHDLYLHTLLDWINDAQQMHSINGECHKNYFACIGKKQNSEKILTAIFASRSKIMCVVRFSKTQN